MGKENSTSLRFDGTIEPFSLSLTLFPPRFTLFPNQSEQPSRQDHMQGEREAGGGGEKGETARLEARVF